MPMCRRTPIALTPARRCRVPSKRTSPSTRAPGTVSCIRFRQRSSVDLPHPDGPMIAVTCPLWHARTRRRARRAPRRSRRRAIRRRCRRARPRSRVAPSRLRHWTAISTSSARDGAESTSRSIAAESEARTRREAGGDADDEDEAEEDERACPGLGVPVVVGADAHRCRSAWAARRSAAWARPTRTGLPNAVKISGAVSPAMRAIGHERAGDDAGQRRAQHDAERRPPPRVAERERRFAHRDRHEANHLLRRARHERNHHRGERDAAGERREVLERANEQLPAQRCRARSTEARSARRTGTARRSRAGSRAARRGRARRRYRSAVRSPRRSARGCPCRRSRSPFRRPASPVGSGIFVKKFQFTDAAPCLQRDAQRMSEQRKRRRRSRRRT